MERAAFSKKILWVLYLSRLQEVGFHVAKQMIMMMMILLSHVPRMFDL